MIDCFLEMCDKKGGKWKISEIKRNFENNWFSPLEKEKMIYSTTTITIS